MNEDIKNLQSLALSAAELFRGSTINFVISGCAISDGKLSAGYVWLDGKVREVAAADISGLSFPLYIYPVDKESSMRMVYLDGTTGPQYFEYGTALTDDASSLSGSYIECESATRGFPGIEQWFRVYALVKSGADEPQSIDSLVTFNGGLETSGTLTAESIYGSSSSFDSVTTETLSVSGSTEFADATVKRLNSTDFTTTTLYVKQNASIESLTVNEIGLAGIDLIDKIQDFENRITALEEANE